MNDVEIDFETVYKTHYKGVYRYCFKILKHVEDAEDITQRVFIRTWRKFDTLHSKDSLRFWLRTVALNEIRNFFDWRKSRKTQEMLSIDENEVQMMAAKPFPVTAKLAINEALRRVPEHYKQSMLMHHVWGMELPEIGALLNIPKRTAGTRAFRGREKMRQRLA